MNGLDETTLMTVSPSHALARFAGILPGTDPNDPPALDKALARVDPKEYIGICWEDDVVWTAYTGTYSEDSGNKGVIWSSRIEWP